MKRMKKLISIGSVTVLTLVLLIVLVSVLEAAKPISVSGSGSWEATIPTSWGNIVSTATLTIDGIDYSGSYTAYLSELSGPNEEGIYKGTTVEQIFDLGASGVIRTVNDRVTLEPAGTTGSYTLKVMSKSVTGSVNGVPVSGGRLSIDGDINNFPPAGGIPATASFQVSGSISY